MAKNNKPEETQAVKDAKAAEATVFGDGASQALPVTSEESNDSFTGAGDLPEGVQGAPAPVIDDGLPVVELPPVTLPEVQEARVFGKTAPGDTAREVAPEQTMQVPLSVLEQMQRQIAELQKNQAGDDAVQDPLSMAPRKKLLNVTYFSLDDGTQYLVTGMKERVFPNGTRAKVYQDGVDQDKKPIYKAILEVANIETGDKKDIEVIYENFIKLSTPVQTEAIKTNEKIIDMTPSDEVVEMTTYAESGGYIKRQGTGVLVRASVQGKLMTFDVVQNGRTFEVTSDVVNVK